MVVKTPISVPGASDYWHLIPDMKRAILGYRGAAELVRIRGAADPIALLVAAAAHQEILQASTAIIREQERHRQ